MLRSAGPLAAPETLLTIDLSKTYSKKMEISG